jgi:hypothetical protein
LVLAGFREKSGGHGHSGSLDYLPPVAPAQICNRTEKGKLADSKTEIGDEWISPVKVHKKI